MRSKLYKLLIILGILLVIIGLILFWLLYNAPKKLEVDFLDVGQGDAILIKTPFGQNVLIDGGPDNSVITELSKNLPWWDRTIDLIILTHPHDDHVGGLNDVLERYKIKQIISTGVLHSAPAYLNWLGLIKEKQIPTVNSASRKNIVFGPGCSLKILYPFNNLTAQETENLNNTSLVFKLNCENSTFIFTGDAEIEAERILLKKNADLDADFLKVGHHGSSDSTSDEFLKAISPSVAIIPVGAGNDFGHPSRRTLKKLESIESKIYRTDLSGTVKIIIQNNKNEIIAEK